jgi:cytochrome P450
MQVQYKGFTRQILGNGLVTAEGEHWAKLRKVANHAFHGESLKVSFYNYSSQFLQIKKIMS